jgi:hypothetical protein
LVYRIQWKRTKVGDLVTLCRDCHELIHLLTKTRNENQSEPIGTTLKKSKAEFDNAAKLLVSLERIYRRFENVSGVISEDKERGPLTCSFCPSLDRHILVNIFSACLENNDSAEWNVRLCDGCYAEFSSQNFISKKDAREYAKKQFTRKSLTVKSNSGNPVSSSQ